MSIREIRDKQRQYLTEHVQSDWDQPEWEEEYRQVVDVALEILHVLNCVLFLGGYNAPVQALVASLLLHEDALLGLF